MQFSRTLRKVIGPIVIVVLWEIAAQLHLVDPMFLPAPSSILRTMYKLAASGVLGQHISYSLFRVLVGFALAVATAVPLGVLMGWFAPVRDLFDSLVELVRPISPIALLPLSMLWFGIGNESKVFIIWFSCLFPILLNTVAAVRGIDITLINAAKSLGANNRELLVKLALPASVPIIFTGMRISFAIGLIVIIASEMVAATYGLGALILTAEQVYQTPEMFVGIVTIAVLGLASDQSLRLLRSYLLPWYQEVGS